MIRSMTTFARKAVSGTALSCSMELKSVNGRYCDVHMRLPRSIAPVEDRIRKLIQKRLKRGRVEFYIQVESAEGLTPSFSPDVAAGKAWLRAAEILSEELRLDTRPTFSDLLSSVPGVISMGQEETDEDAIWKQLSPGLDELLDRAIEMSRREGDDLEKDIRARLKKIQGLLDQITSRKEEQLAAAQQALKERVMKLLENTELDEMRIAHEAAIMADRLDITEETVRASSHLVRFAEYLESDEPVGRRLDFLTQELFREFNTMASKSWDSIISQAVVEVKGELEKIREQVQNIV